MQTTFWIKYGIFILIVTLISSMVYGLPLEPVVNSLGDEAAASESDLGWNPLGFGIYNWVVGGVSAVASSLFTMSNSIYAGLRMLTFDYTGMPEILHWFMGGMSVVMIVFFVIDVVHGFI